MARHLAVRFSIGWRMRRPAMFRLDMRTSLPNRRARTLYTLVSAGWRLANRHGVVAAACAYASLTIVMTWPLPARAGSTLQDTGDPLMQIWVMRRVQHQLVTDPLNLYQGNIYYPFNDTLAYADEALSTALLAWPVYFVTSNDVLAYNLVFLASFWLVGLAMFLLTRELGAASGAAFVAGLTAAFAPARFGHLSHLNLLMLGWLPLAMWAAVRYVRTRRRQYAAVVAIALAMQLLASLQLALFATLALGLFLACLVIAERRQPAWTRRDLAWGIAALAVPYGLFTLTLLPHLRVAEEFDFMRTRAEIEMLAATPRSYFSVFVTNQFWALSLTTRPEPFFPGVVALAGAALALLELRSQRRWIVVFTLLLTVTAVLLSFGFALNVRGHSVPMPYALLYEHIPALRSIRGVGRFGLLTAISVPIAAAIGLSAFWRVKTPQDQTRAALLGAALTIALVGAVCLEFRSAVATNPAPTNAHAMAVYEWLALQPEGPVAEFPAAGLYHPPHGTLQLTQYMYGSTRHWNPMLAGYGSFTPEPHLRLIEVLGGRDQPSMVTPANVGVLQDLGIRWVLIHRTAGYDWAAAVATAGSLPELRWAADVGDSTVFQLAEPARAPVSGRFVVASEAFVPGPFSLVVEVANPHPNPALAHLRTALAAHVRWRSDDGRVVKQELVPLTISNVVQPGVTFSHIALLPPAMPGAYRLEVTAGDDVIPPVERSVTVLPAPTWGIPPLAFGIARFSSVRPRAGEPLDLTVCWEVVAPLGADYAATLQLIDRSGVLRASVDLWPYAGMPATSAWQVGQAECIAFSLPIPADLTPGDYRLLTAFYAPLADYPRIPMTLPDGSQALEAFLQPVEVRR